MEQMGELFNAATPDFRWLFNAIPSPCLVLAPDFSIVEVNEAHLKATQSSRDQFSGVTFSKHFRTTLLTLQQLAWQTCANLCCECFEPRFQTQWRFRNMTFH